MSPPLIPHRLGPRPLRVIGVTRTDDPRALLIVFSARPTDDEMRDVHEIIRELFGPL